MSTSGWTSPVQHVSVVGMLHVQSQVLDDRVMSQAHVLQIGLVAVQHLWPLVSDHFKIKGQLKTF